MKKSKAILGLCVILAIMLMLLPGCSERTDGIVNDINKMYGRTDETTGNAGETTSSAVVTPTPSSTGEQTSNVGDVTVGIDEINGDPGEITGESVFSYSEGIADNGFFDGIRALDYVELFNYQAMDIPNEIHLVTEEAIQTEIGYILADYPSTIQVTDREVANGDSVNIDYVGSVDGVEFDRGSTEGMGADVIIGVTSYIDDFLEQLIGHMPGETVNVEVTFPDDYQEETLQGKDALFVTVINYIKEDVEAEMSDEFVMENLSADYGWSTVEELTEGLRTYMQKNAMQEYIKQYFATKVTIQSVPDEMIAYQEKGMLYFYEGYADYYGIPLEELLSYEGYADVDEFVEANYDVNLENAVYMLVVQAIAEDSGISVDDLDLLTYFIDNLGTSDYSTYEAQFGLPYLKQVVLSQKIIDYIIDNAVLL